MTMKKKIKLRPFNISCFQNKYGIANKLQVREISEIQKLVKILATRQKYKKLHLIFGFAAFGITHWNICRKNLKRPVK